MAGTSARPVVQPQLKQELVAYNHVQKPFGFNWLGVGGKYNRHLTYRLKHLTGCFLSAAPRKNVVFRKASPQSEANFQRHPQGHPAVTKAFEDHLPAKPKPHLCDTQAVVWPCMRCNPFLNKNTINCSGNSFNLKEEGGDPPVSLGICKDTVAVLAQSPGNSAPAAPAFCEHLGQIPEVVRAKGIRNQ